MLKKSTWLTLAAPAGLLQPSDLPELETTKFASVSLCNLPQVLGDFEPVALSTAALAWVHQAPLAESPDQFPDEDQALVDGDLVDAQSPLGRRANRFVSILLLSLAHLQAKADFSAADVVEFLSKIVDAYSDGDAAACVAILDRQCELLRDLLVPDESPKGRQRLLVARAVLISVINRLIRILEGSEYYGIYGAKARLLVFCVLPVSFDGISNRTRGREAPIIYKSVPSIPVPRPQEKVLHTSWTSAIELRQKMQLGSTSLTYEDFLLFVKVNRFLQDPVEYTSQCLLAGLEGIKSDTLWDDDDEREEGEEDEEDEERAHRRRQRQAERHIMQLEGVDALSARLEEVRRLIGVFKKRFAKPPKYLSKSSFAPQHAVHLLKEAHKSALAFIEIYEELPAFLILSTLMMLACLKIHMEWPQRSDEQSLCTRWAEKINPVIMKTYKKTLTQIQDFLESTAPLLDADWLNASLLHELADMIQKYEGFSLPSEVELHAADSADSQVAPWELDQSVLTDTSSSRLKNFKEAVLPRFDALLADNAAETTSISPFSLEDTELREEYCLSSALPLHYENLPLNAKILQRHYDHLEKMLIDADPDNAIEPQERLTATCIAQWRILRTAFLSGVSNLESVAAPASLQDADTPIGLAYFVQRLYGQRRKPDI